MANILSHSPVVLRSREYGFRLIEQTDRLRLVPLRWSTFTWILLSVMLFLLFLVYKGLQVDVTWMKIVFVGFPLSLAIASIFEILAQMFDGVTITADCITFRYRLVRRSVPIDRQLEVQLRQKIERWVSDGDPQVKVTEELWLVGPSKEHHLFDYYGHKEDDAVPMAELGERLKTAIQKRIG
jgi:hypothetical protein